MDNEDRLEPCWCGSTRTRKPTRETAAESAVGDNAESQYIAKRWVCDADPTHEQQGVTG